MHIDTILRDGNAVAERGSAVLHKQIARCEYIKAVAMTAELGRLVRCLRDLQNMADGLVNATVRIDLMVDDYDASE